MNNSVEGIPKREGMLSSAPSGGRGTKAEKKEKADAEAVHADHIGCAESLAPGDVDPVSDGQSGGSDSIVERACPGIWDRTGNQAVRIPSSNELAREFGIARSSVRIALEQLTAEGILVTRKGCGTFDSERAGVFLFRVVPDGMECPECGGDHADAGRCANDHSA